MSKRLQVLMSEEELGRFQNIARSQHISLGEWVRRTLSQAAEEKSQISVEQKLRAIQKASEYSFPTADIETMNAEIEQGYLSGLP